MAKIQHQDYFDSKHAVLRQLQLFAVVNVLHMEKVEVAEDAVVWQRQLPAA